MSEQRSKAPLPPADSTAQRVREPEAGRCAEHPRSTLVCNACLAPVQPVAPLEGQALSEHLADEQRRMYVHDKNIIDGVKRMLERVQLEGLGRSCLDQKNPGAEERAWKFAIATALNALSRGEWRQP